MNDSDMNEQELLDLEELLNPLRSAEPTRAMRSRNRNCALGVAAVRPWWARSVSVPVPVALAVAASLLVAMTLAFRSSDHMVPSETPLLVRVTAVPLPVPSVVTAGCRVEHSYVGSLQSAAYGPTPVISGLGGSS